MYDYFPILIEGFVDVFFGIIKSVFIRGISLQFSLLIMVLSDLDFKIILITYNESEKFSPFVFSGKFV